MVRNEIVKMWEQAEISWLVRKMRRKRVDKLKMGKYTETQIDEMMDINRKLERLTRTTDIFEPYTTSDAYKVMHKLLEALGDEFN